MRTVQKKNNVVNASAMVDSMLKQKIKMLNKTIEMNTQKLAEDYLGNFNELAGEIWTDKYLLEHFEMCVQELSEADSYAYVDFHTEEAHFARGSQQDLKMAVSGIAREVANWEWSALQKIQVFHNTCIQEFRK